MITLSDSKIQFNLRFLSQIGLGKIELMRQKLILIEFKKERLLPPPYSPLFLLDKMVFTSAGVYLENLFFRHHGARHRGIRHRPAAPGVGPHPPEWIDRLIPIHPIHLWLFGLPPSIPSPQNQSPFPP
jgi:hypothetical protein